MENAEQEILYQKKLAVFINPLNGRIKRKVLRGLAYLAGGYVVRKHMSKSTAKTIKGTGVKMGDIFDAIDRWRKTSVTLTSKHLIMRWVQGRFIKSSKSIIMPLKYAKSVEKEGKVQKILRITFEVPIHEQDIETVNFELKIFFYGYRRGLHEKRRETWLNELSRIIS